MISATHVIPLQVAKPEKSDNWASLPSGHHCQTPWPLLRPVKLAWIEAVAFHAVWGMVWPSLPFSTKAQLTHTPPVQDARTGGLHEHRDQSLQLRVESSLNPLKRGEVDVSPLHGLHLRELALQQFDGLELDLFKFVLGALLSLTSLHVRKSQKRQRQIQGQDEMIQELAECGQIILGLPHLQELSGLCALFAFATPQELHTWQVTTSPPEVAEDSAKDGHPRRLKVWRRLWSLNGEWHWLKLYKAILTTWHQDGFWTHYFPADWCFNGQTKKAAKFCKQKLVMPHAMGLQRLVLSIIAGSDPEYVSCWCWTWFSTLAGMHERSQSFDSVSCFMVSCVLKDTKEASFAPKGIQ